LVITLEGDLVDNVQLENGYTAIAHEILEHMAKVKISPTQYRIIFVVWRFTYGFKRKEHDLSLSFIAKATGCDRRQVQRELKDLVNKRLLIQKSVKGNRVVMFNKHYSQWFAGLPVGEIDNGETVNGEIDIGESVAGAVGEIDNTPVGEIDNQENYIYKTNIKTIYSRLFDFWNSKKIIVHKKLNDKAKQKIAKLLETYTCEDIEKSISNYEIVLHQDKYYWSYAWTLEEFLQRGFEKFLSKTCFTNFLADKQNSSQGNKTPQKGNFDQRKYTDSDFDKMFKEV
jgi:phage replication O-like protein O